MRPISHSPLNTPEIDVVLVDAVAKAGGMGITHTCGSCTGNGKCCEGRFAGSGDLKAKMPD
jgi:hypothetical protein